MDSDTGRRADRDNGHTDAKGGQAQPGVGPVTSTARGSAGRGRQRILVVDDNVPSAECLAELIKLWGHETRLAHDGALALDSAREYRPDVILLDIELPSMDGFSIARALRRDPRFLTTILLAMTGHSSEETTREAIDAGFDRHLVKPLELDDLEDLLARLAGRQG